MRKSHAFSNTLILLSLTPSNFHSEILPEQYYSLSDESCINELSKCFEKLKYIKKCNLIIRRWKIYLRKILSFRTNGLNESNTLCPFLYRMLKLKKFRIELTKYNFYPVLFIIPFSPNRSVNINERGLIKLFIALLKYPSLESCDINLLE